jgi:hypothetical protein
MKKIEPPAPNEIEENTISIRAFAQGPSQGKKRPPKRGAQRHVPQQSRWTLIFDTETTTDPGQRLRFGTYQGREGELLHESGIFYDPAALTDNELLVIIRYAKDNQLQAITHEQFVDKMFYRYGYWLRGTVVWFNLPFDISRIAIGHSSARKTSAKKSETRRQATDNTRYLNLMRNGFSFRLSNDKRNPRIRVKHLSRKAALIRFSAPFRSQDARSIRKRNGGTSVHWGFFVDTSTFATAQFARSFTLQSLANFLEVQNRKLSVDEHGGPITREYVEYAVRDVQATWECYQRLSQRYESFRLTETPAHKIYSEASLGKAYLKAMSVKPWQEAQSDAPPKVIAMIMASYYGGRSEVRIRRELRQVILCDFLSMYPTVCTLMGLWQFVTAEGMTWHDATEKTRAFLERISLDDLKTQEIWKHLCTIVRVAPDRDVFPVRARYDGSGPATIAANHLQSKQPVYFTLADCIASKLLTGTTPQIVEAWTFRPGKPQGGLRPIAIGGNPEYLVHPLHDDFYKRLIELRNEVKGERDSAAGSARKALDTEQNALKIAANATSYGIFVEVNVNEQADDEAVMIHTATGRSYRVDTTKLETAGQFFHPLLATLITGAARLMLAITESLVLNRGLKWAFCDTDSMAIAKPGGMDPDEFYTRVDEIVEWFAGLNPYIFPGSILKVEDVNFDARDGRTRVPLYCGAVSAKRYALFNLDENDHPVLRKASAHGLGHLRAPYDAKNPANGIPAPAGKSEKIEDNLKKLGVELWQHDLWWLIAVSAVSENPDRVSLKFHPALEQPAISRYAATTPKLLRWFSGFNEGQPYAAQVKPFGFLHAMFAKGPPDMETGEEIIAPRRTARRRLGTCKPVAPYDKDHAKAVKLAFDRDTRLPVPVTALKSYREVIAGYHLHPESKFRNGEAFDRAPRSAVTCVRLRSRISGRRRTNGKSSFIWVTMRRNNSITGSDRKARRIFLCRCKTQLTRSDRGRWRAGRGCRGGLSRG